MIQSRENARTGGRMEGQTEGRTDPFIGPFWLPPGFQKHQTDVNDVVLVFYYELWIYFTPFSNVFIIGFEQVIVSWSSSGLQE